ncbi:5'-AMP-activated protein kinase, beta-1 subunit [Giardia muris]|uniref:5'-AMP-activated protein kinase, beta-1 subunit n=1 Tax=Giardia muris TaxID=5742 RepID=A0A4Z1SR84_GIAMU|nr:5'-AMP-activated protein kinase, beta-1 subunit [Giardia muris]|eukprot:TNJ28220.1 5'-AMP-activated protein kinase, beta-1 subunit [Giardia muris]
MGQNESKVPGADAPAGQNIEVTVTWREKADSAVYCVGSFNNWTERVPLQRNHAGIWFAVLYLPPGVYQYKFIVDGNWVCAQDQPQCRDSDGNLNNVIHISHSGHLMEPANQEDLRQDFVAGQMHGAVEGWFTTVIPENAKDIWKTFPSEIPHQLLKTVLNDTLSRTDTYEPSLLLPIPDHVTLTHFFRQKRRKMVTATAASEKHRSKYVTVVLYSPCETPVEIPHLATIVADYAKTRCIIPDV